MEQAQTLAADLLDSRRRVHVGWIAVLPGPSDLGCWMVSSEAIAVTKSDGKWTSEGSRLQFHDTTEWGTPGVLIHRR